MAELTRPQWIGITLQGYRTRAGYRKRKEVVEILREKWGIAYCTANSYVSGMEHGQLFRHLLYQNDLTVPQQRFADYLAAIGVSDDEAEVLVEEIQMINHDFTHVHPGLNVIVPAQKEKQRREMRTKVLDEIIAKAEATGSKEVESKTAIYRLSFPRCSIEICEYAYRDIPFRDCYVFDHCPGQEFQDVLFGGESVTYEGRAEGMSEVRLDAAGCPDADGEGPEPFVLRGGDSDNELTEEDEEKFDALLKIIEKEISS